MTDISNPVSVHPRDAALEAVAHAREAALFTQQCVERLEDLATRQDTPARKSILTLTAATPVKASRARSASKSIGIFNAEALTIYVGLDGSARQAADGIAVPPKSALVLPIATTDIEVGVDAADATSVAALATGDATVLLLRFDAVQPFFFGAWAG